MDIRDKIITGTFAIGHDGRKEPTNWKDYALKLEQYLKKWEDSSGKETGMKWVKASERLPEKNYNYFVRVFYFNDPKQGTYNAASFWDGKQFIDALRTNYGQPVPLVVSKWLDESVPPYKEEEIEWESIARAFKSDAEMWNEKYKILKKEFDKMLTNSKDSSLLQKDANYNPPYKEEEKGLDGIAGVPNKEGILEYDNAVDLLRDIDKSLYLGDDLNDKEILDWYIEVTKTIKDSIKLFLTSASKEEVDREDELWDEVMQEMGFYSSHLDNIKSKFSLIRKI